MKLLRLLFAPFRFLLRLLLRPLKWWSRSRAAGDGWIELHLEGGVTELRAPSRFTALVRRWLGEEEDPKVTLSAIRRLVDAIIADKKTKGLLVRIGPIGGGWASAATLRRQLRRVADAGRTVVVHFKGTAGNREYLVATAAKQIWSPPAEAIAPVGAAATTLFFKEVLDKAGVTVEVASAGRFKSAPEAFTRTERSEADREQTTALVNRIDDALLDAVGACHGVDRAGAEALLDTAPVVGSHAATQGLCHAALRDEDVPDAVAKLAELEKPPRLVAAGGYLDQRTLLPLARRPAKRVGIVEVHGAIVERASPYSGALDAVALEKTVVANLRAAQADKRIGAVILHVNSPGGGVAASDAIYAAVKRLDEEKPVIACFGDIAASGGYYVACGARAIVAQPLTVTGSIGVFGMLPVAAALGVKLGLHHDVIKNRVHADMYDIWRTRTEAERAHAEREVGALYDDFVQLVAAARKRERDEIHEVAQGRVWIGADAQAQGLVDGLGGFEEAMDRAKAAAKARFHIDPVLIRTKRTMRRPAPKKPDSRLLTELAGLTRAGPKLLEMAALEAAAPMASGWAYTPLDVR